MTSNRENPYTKRVRDLGRVADVFFLGTRPETLATPDSPALQQIVESFNANIDALFWATELPHLMLFYASGQRIFERYLAAERIRALDPRDLSIRMNDPTYETSDAYLKKKAEEDAQAAVKASERFREEHSAQELTGQAIEDLLPFLDHPLVSMASKELMRHAVILLWVALEALATDLFVVTVNQKPELAIQLLKDEQCRKKFQSRDLSRIVEQYGFELSNRMGDILKSLGNMDDPETIKSVFEVISPKDEALRIALAEADLWRLYQRRNLLVHRAGIIDRHFLERTGEQLPIGTKLAVVSADVTKYFDLVRHIAKELIRSVAEVVE